MKTNLFIIFPLFALSSNFIDDGLQSFRSLSTTEISQVTRSMISWKQVETIRKLLSEQKRDIYVGMNTITRNGDVINFDFREGKKYIRYEANCSSRMHTKILEGELNQKHEVIHSIKTEPKYSKIDEIQFEDALKLVCE